MCTHTRTHIHKGKEQVILSTTVKRGKSPPPHERQDVGMQGVMRAWQGKVASVGRKSMCSQPLSSSWAKGAMRVTQVVSALVPKVVLFPKSLLHMNWGTWERKCHGSGCRHNKEPQLRSFFGLCVLYINQIDQPHLSSHATNNSLEGKGSAINLAGCC